LSDLKDEARQIFLDTLSQIDLSAAIRRQVSLQGDQLTICGEEFDLRSLTKLLAIGFGKASIRMGREFEHLLGERITAGALVTNAVPQGVSLNRFKIIEGGHPIPNRGSLQAADEIISLLKSADEKTLVIFLVSGGGSALIEKPVDESISLEDIRELNRVLVTCGAVIREMNAVRKHLSAIKGGRLAALAYPARQVTLYVSDVNNDDISTIASDPTGPDETTLDEFYQVVERYDLLSKLPANIASLISSRQISETPKSDWKVFRNSSRYLLMGNSEALRVARRIAEERGFVVEIADDLVEGHYRGLSDELLSRLLALRDRHPQRRVCLLSGGEVICPVYGNGIGGRNQETVLYLAIKLAGISAVASAALSAGTDGIDGNSDAAGAVADNLTLKRAVELGLDADQYLKNNDSYNFFRQLGDLIITGPTGNNVRDLRIMLAQ